jgi:uncharacterized protein YkuJ
MSYSAQQSALLNIIQRLENLAADVRDGSMTPKDTAFDIESEIKTIKTVVEELGA